MSDRKLEDYCYLIAIIWIPVGVDAHSPLITGIGMVAAGLGLFLHIFHRNQRVAYKTIHFPNREEDETVEFHKIQQDYRDNANQR